MKIVSSYCRDVFPSHYEITDHYINLYTAKIQRRVEDIIAYGTEELKDTEYLTIFEWAIKTFPEMMSDHKVNISQEKVPKLLSPVLERQAESRFLQSVEKDFQVWMEGALEKEFEDMGKKEPGVGTKIISQNYLPTPPLFFVDKSNLSNLTIFIRR